MRARRVLTEADRHAWQHYVQQVAKLAGTPPVPPDRASEAAAPTFRPGPPRRHADAAPLEVGTPPGGIDRATWGRLRAGKLRVERTLDLHGRTLQHAHAELHDFLGRAIADRVRCVEVITGRGSGESGGAIRREFPLWLNSPALRPFVLAASHPHAANQGSVRLLLRRAR